MPVPAGHSIGSANWVIKAGDYKVSYVSSSSKLTNHTLPMEVVSLANPNVLLLGNLALNPVYSPSNKLTVSNEYGVGFSIVHFCLDISKNNQITRLVELLQDIN